MTSQLLDETWVQGHWIPDGAESGEMLWLNRLTGTVSLVDPARGSGVLTPDEPNEGAGEEAEQEEDEAHREAENEVERDEPNAAGEAVPVGDRDGDPAEADHTGIVVGAGVAVADTSRGEVDAAAAIDAPSPIPAPSSIFADGSNTASIRHEVMNPLGQTRADVARGAQSDIEMSTLSL